MGSLIGIVFLSAVSLGVIPPDRAEAPVELALDQKIQALDYAVGEEKWEASKDLAKYCKANPPLGTRVLIRKLAEGTRPVKNPEKVRSGLIDAVRLLREFPEDAVDVLVKIFAEEVAAGRFVEDASDMVIRSVVDAMARSRAAAKRPSLSPVFPELRRMVPLARREIGPNLRRSAIDALRQLDGEGLILLADDFADLLGEGTKVHISAADAIASVGESLKAHPKVGYLIDGLIAMLKEEDFLARQSAARALGRMGRVAQEASHRLAMLLDENNEPMFGVRRAACVALRRIGPSSEAISALLVAMDDGDPDVRDNAAAALEKDDDRYIEGIASAVAPALADPDDQVRRLAIGLLGRNARNNPKATGEIERLGRALRAARQSPETRREVGRILAGLGERGTGELAASIKKEAPREARLIAIDELTAIIPKVGAGSSLGQFYRLQPLLAEPDPEICLSASKAIAELSRNIIDKGGPHSSLDTLIEPLKTSAALVRRRMAEDRNAYAESVASLETTIELIKSHLKVTIGWVDKTADAALDSMKPYVLPTILALSLPLLWVTMSLVLALLYKLRPDAIVHMSEWTATIIDEVKPDDKIGQTIAFLALVVLWPLRCFGGARKPLMGWVVRRRTVVERALKRSTCKASYEILVGDKGRVDPAKLREEIAGAFAEDGSNLWILGQDEPSRRWLATRVAQLAHDHQTRPMLPVFVDETELIDSGPEKLGPDEVRRFVCDKIRQMIGVRTPISAMLHGNLDFRGMILVIVTLDEFKKSRLPGLVHGLYKNWAIVATDDIGEAHPLYSDRIVRLTARLAAERGRDEATHLVGQNGQAD